MQEKPQTEERDDSIVEDLDFDNPDYQFIPKNCMWVQRGIYLICTSCELQHAVYVGTEKILTGLDESGQPILKSKWIDGRPSEAVGH